MIFKETFWKMKKSEFPVAQVTKRLDLYFHKMVKWHPEWHLNVSWYLSLVYLTQLNWKPVKLLFELFCENLKWKRNVNMQKSKVALNATKHLLSKWISCFSFLTSIYLFKGNNENTRTMWNLFKVNNKEIRTTSMTSLYGFMVNFEQISNIILVFLFLILNK